MVGMMAVGMGLQAVGGLFGGRARKKAAKREAARMAALGNQAMAALDTDQARAIEYRSADEARLKDATGIDMVKLVADAEAAGFNPLTVLNATGGAGYDGRGAVLTTPFIGKADGFFQQMGLTAGAGQAVVQSSGYVGDAMAGFGQNVFAVGQLGAQQKHEMTMQANSFRDAAAARSAIYGGSAPRGQNGRTAPMVGANMATGPFVIPGAGGPRRTAGPGKSSEWIMNPDGSVYVPYTAGGGMSYDPRQLAAMGMEPNTAMDPSNAPDEWSQMVGAYNQFKTWVSGSRVNTWMESWGGPQAWPTDRPRVGVRTPSGNPRGN